MRAIICSYKFYSFHEDWPQTLHKITFLFNIIFLDIFFVLNQILWMLTLWRHYFFIKWNITYKFIEGHERSQLCLKSNSTKTFNGTIMKSWLMFFMTTFSLVFILYQCIFIFKLTNDNHTILNVYLAEYKYKWW